MECKYVTEESLREWKNGNINFKVQNPVPVLRFLYELCWTVVCFSTVSVPFLPVEIIIICVVFCGFCALKYVFIMTMFVRFGENCLFKSVKQHWIQLNFLIKFLMKR